MLGTAAPRLRSTTGWTDVADTRLRETERLAAQGDPDAQARLLALRIRSGLLPREQVLWAAHLGDAVATAVVSDPQIFVECSCKDREPQRGVWSDNPPRLCLTCKGRGRIVVETDLIHFVRKVDVPLMILIPWVCDCAGRSPDLIRQDPRLQEILHCTRRWLNGQAVDRAIYEVASYTSSRGLGRAPPAFTLAQTVAGYPIPPDRRPLTRQTLAFVVSQAYGLAGSTRVERGWQTQRLVYYILGGDCV